MSHISDGIKVNDSTVSSPPRFKNSGPVWPVVLIITCSVDVFTAPSQKYDTFLFLCSFIFAGNIYISHYIVIKFIKSFLNVYLIFITNKKKSDKLGSYLHTLFLETDGIWYKTSENDL